jgi:hypothetical protein
MRGKGMIMAGSFFDTLSVKEKQRIKERTDTLIDMMKEWTRRYPFIRTTRIPMASLLVATALPKISIPDALIAAQMTLWLFGVDDIADERIATLAEMRHRAEQWHSIASHGPGEDIDDNDDLTMVLLDMMENLSKSHLFKPLREYWAFHVRLLVETMIKEYEDWLAYNAHRVLPSLDEYLHNGLYTIGLPCWSATALILHRDSSVIEHFEPINEAIEQASIAARIYNDVRTFDRETQEGSSLNSILITYHTMLNRDPNTTEENALTEAKQYVLQLADAYAQRFYDLAGQLETDSGQFEETTSRVVAFHAHFYGRSEHDYHITSQPEINEMLGYSRSF